jgi:hypothetical protein
MKHSFVDRQYLPSTGKDRSEWEIILEELIRMGLLVKHEPLSEGGEGQNVTFDLLFTSVSP